HAGGRWGSWPSDAGQVSHVDLFAAPAYQAYFAPGARHFMDARFELHANTVTAFQEAYAALRRAGQPGTQAQIEQRNAIWQRLFREWDVSCLIVDQRSVLNPQNPREAVPLYQLLLNDTDPQTGQPHWTVLRYADGRNFLLGWNGSRNWDRLKEQRLDVRREVFQQTSPPPPVSEPPPPPRESLLAVRLRGNVERPPLPLLEAEWHANLLRSALLQVEQIERQRPEQISHLWMHVGSVLASGTFQVPMLWIRDMVPHAEAYLAARSARFAIAAATNLVNPVEVRYRAGAYKALHDAYQAIYRLEARLLPGMPQPPQRELQIVSAMRQVVDLNPFDAFTHQDLAVYYLRRLGSNGQPEPIIDLGIDHYRKALAIFQQLTAGDPRRTPADVEIQFKRRLHELHGFKIDEIEKELKQRTEAWAAQAPRRNPLKPTENLAQRAGFALQLGLAGLALEELRTALTNITPGTTLSGGELLLYADVHLRIGEVVPILELLAVPGVEARLGSANYHAFGAMAKAAAGDYAGSIAHRRQLIANTELDMVSVLLLAGRLHTLGGDEPRGTHFTAVEQGGLQASSFANLLSEHWVSIGLLELEAGRPQEAAAAFRHACRDVQRPSPFEGLAARYYFLITGRFLDQEQP
ncbi:MAG TPA: hypothetical protein PKD86_01650, partial [Gemmatales bacterium]|nr:hypothetical protein [Gemmatales bacterium]